MFHFDVDEGRHLLGFITPSRQIKTSKASCCIVVGGLTDGFLSLRYVPSLAERLNAMGWSVCQVNLSSSWNQFGTSSVMQDAKELWLLVDHLRKQRGFHRIGIIGHSTGCQDIMHMMKQYDEQGCPPHRSLDFAVFQGGISDRQAMVGTHGFDGLLAEANAALAEGQPDKVLSEKLFGIVSISAYRFHSMASKLGDEDFFSTDLTQEELAPRLKPLTVPSLFVYSEDDEYVKDMDALKAFLNDTFMPTASSFSDCAKLVFLDGDHGLEKQEYRQAFVEQVAAFINEVSDKS